MDKNILASELREIQIDAMIEHIMAESDDEIIDEFITCDECMDKLVSKKELNKIIEEVDDIEEFLDRCEESHKKKLDSYKYN
jgi:uncharacterized protein Yka (UPF0111/DUF47 family)